MKKYLIMLLCALSLTLLLVGCGGTNPPAGDDGGDGEQNEQTETITGVTFEDVRVQEDGNEHEITVTGTLPEGVSVDYNNTNKGTLPGKYNATAILSGEGYTTLTLHATLEIYTVAIEGVTFESARIWEDGQKHTLEVTGTLPEGVTVVYQNNEGTLPGTYDATATLSGIGYTTLKLTATLEIYTIDIEGVTFPGKKLPYTGFNYTLEVEGTIPDGVNVKYENNVGKEEGTYNATATLSGYGYNELVLHATLEIYDLSDAATNVLNAFKDRPDPWEYLPDALHEENMAYDTAPVSDFTDFVNTSSIGKRTIGKQLNVLYDVLGHADVVLKYYDMIDGAFDAIVTAYQEYINLHPDDFKSWEGEAGGFKLKITLEDTASTLLAGNGTVSIELSTNSATGERYGRIQITGGFVLKYETTENTLKLALIGTVSGVGYSSMVEFLRDKDTRKVTGYVTEFWGTESTDVVKTKALLYVDASRTIIMSNKRETDDLIIKGYEEIYSSVTGEMLGGEVTESVTIGSGFDTLWFPMDKVTGITSVKAIHEKNGKNLDTIYVNGSANVLQTSTVLISQTREYDIEMKDVWYIVKQADGSYEKVKCSVPMLFIQTKYFNDFSSHIVSKNKDTFDTTPSASTAVYNELTSTFDTMYEVYETLKELVTSQEITDYIGTADSFFSKEN